ncbi:MAG: aldose epimerase family protein [Thermoguttaceae bacterium]
MSVTREPWGSTPQGQQIERFTLVNKHGLRVKIMTYGATITAVETPDRDGQMANITLGLESAEDYLAGHPCFGSTVGRYANRIAKGRFCLDGVEYRLATNNGPNHLHGGLRGFDKVVWRAELVECPGMAGVAFSYRGVDGEEGYPGTLDAQVTYSLTDDNELRMEYAATTDRPTVVNLTNHAYWNLAGAGSGDVLGHQLTLHAERYLPTDEGLIPTGELRPVADTPMDFRRPTPVGSHIEAAGGYDHCYVLDGWIAGQEPRLAAQVTEPRTGRVMEVLTTEPAVQLYTANGLDGRLGAFGRTYGKYSGLCLEAQHFPDAPNQPAFPSTELRPGQMYRQRTVHRFGTA